MVSARDKLIQLKYFNRTYFLPYRLHKLNSEFSAVCWTCTHSTGDFFHTFWTCPFILSYWKSVLRVVSSISHTPGPYANCVCLLGLVEELFNNKLLRVFITMITIFWKKPSPPTPQFWKKLLNINLPLYQDTYNNTSCPKTYQKVWSCWLDKSSTATPLDVWLFFCSDSSIYSDSLISSLCVVKRVLEPSTKNDCTQWHSDFSSLYIYFFFTGPCPGQTGSLLCFFFVWFYIYINQ